MTGYLALAGLAMGLAASPHCVTMCGSPCAAMTCHGRSDAVGFHAGRIVGYTVAGAVAAASVTALGAWTRTSPALQPLWLLVHLGFLGLGLWCLAAGHMPRRMARDGAVPMTIVQRDARPWRTGLAGLAWVGWPCGALQAALLVSALADGPIGGGLVMACFAVASMPALAAAPWLWGRWRSWSGHTITPAAAAAWGYRVAGAGLALSSGWAIASGLRDPLAALCRT
jgi:sulfite exporter TauE/SafE